MIVSKTMQNLLCKSFEGHDMAVKTFVRQSKKKLLFYFNQKMLENKDHSITALVFKFFKFLDYIQ